MKRIITMLMAVLLTLGCGCSEQKEHSMTVSNTSTSVITTSQTTEIPQEAQQLKEEYANSTAENDTDLGLKNMKMDTAEGSLTEAEKEVIAYFDDDYFTPEYEFIRRYPQVFDGTQIEENGIVVKVISQTQEEYKLAVRPYGLDESANEFVCITGTPKDALFMEDDEIVVYGRYHGVETFEMDGTTYTVPNITVHKAYFSGEDRFNAAAIKRIVRTIFGENVDIRRPVAGQDQDSYGYDIDEWMYVAEFENQSNAKFKTYVLSPYGGQITDLNASHTIERYVDFSADFEHFLLYTYDYELETQTLEYYDKELNKIWKREFEEVTPPEAEGLMTRTYDFTKNNVYCLVNNELYIINIETGEDTFLPLYVGKKIEVRKLNDGILLVSMSKSDGIMKIDLTGSVVWKTNTPEDIWSVEGIQVASGNIIMDLRGETEDHYFVVNSKTGEVVIDAVQK